VDDIIENATYRLEACDWQGGIRTEAGGDAGPDEERFRAGSAEPAGDI